MDDLTKQRWRREWAKREPGFSLHDISTGDLCDLTEAVIDEMSITDRTTMLLDTLRRRLVARDPSDDAASEYVVRHLTEVANVRSALMVLVREGLRWVHDPDDAPSVHRGGVCTWCEAVRTAREALKRKAPREATCK